jgi:hypothetical protein
MWKLTWTMMFQNSLVKSVFHFNRIVTYCIAFSFVSKSLVPDTTAHAGNKEIRYDIIEVETGLCV